MWPIEVDVLFSKIENIRDTLRIASNEKGETKDRLMEAAHSMAVEFAKSIKKTSVIDDDDE